MNMIRTIAEVNMDSVMNNGMSFAERLKEGGQMILIVMSFVFSVIFLIWLSQTIISFFVVKLSSAGAKKNKPEEAEAPVLEADEVSETSQAEDDSALVAVITAAISAYRASESEDGSALPFRVVSFKRTKNGKPWNS